MWHCQDCKRSSKLLLQSWKIKPDVGCNSKRPEGPFVILVAKGNYFPGLLYRYDNAFYTAKEFDDALECENSLVKYHTSLLDSRVAAIVSICLIAACNWYKQFLLSLFNFYFIFYFQHRSLLDIFFSCCRDHDSKQELIMLQLRLLLYIKGLSR